MKRILCFLLSFVMIVSLTTSISASVNVNGVVSASVDEASPDSSLPQDYEKSGSCGDKASWHYYEDTKTLVISGEGAVERPDYYKPYFDFHGLPFEKAVIQEGITELGSYAFSKCEFLKEVSLPDSLTKIGDSVFGYCKSLKSITIPKNVSFWGMNNFYYCESLEEIKVAPENKTFDSRDNCNAVITTEGNMLRDVCKNTTIPDSVTSIGAMAYCGAIGIKEITIPDNVKDIYGQAFQECVDLETVRLHSDVNLYPAGIFSKCKKLKNVYLPDGLTSIGMQEFSECISLESIAIPSSVKWINQSAFLDCTALKTVVIEDGVQGIGPGAFSGCTALEEIVIPKSVQEIQIAAFKDCTALKSVKVYNPECVIGDMDITFPEDAVIYGYEGSTAQEYAEHYVREFVALSDDNSQQDYTASGSCDDNATWYYYGESKTLIIKGEGKVEVESYDDGPEYKNLPFEKAVVLEGINTLGHYAFAYCESLKEISLPDSLEVIQDRIFDGCKNLTSLTIPKNVNSIGVALFNECYSLTELKVDPENTEFDSRDNCNAVIHTKYNRLIRGIRTSVIPESVCSIGGGAYVCSPGIVEVIIPDTVTELYGQVFMGCWDLETVVLPSSLKEIGDGLFSDLGKLKNITIPDGVELINYCAFQRCVSLENIIIPGSVKKVVQSAFSGCSGLKSVTIEEGVEILGGFAFGHCRSLESVVIPKSVKEIGPHAFVNGDSLESITIYNPQCSISDYAQTIPEHTVIYGYEGSTAQEYAEHYVREFVALPEPEYSLGDVDLDGNLSIMDATEIQLYIAQLVQWKAEICEQLADADGDGDVSVMDVTAVQMMLAGLM